jgi:hypothetical protein
MLLAGLLSLGRGKFVLCSKRDYMTRVPFFFSRVGRGHPSLVYWNTNEGGTIVRFNKSLEGQIWALVLKPTGEALHDYRRLGIARVSEVLAERWEAQVITIV